MLDSPHRQVKTHYKVEILVRIAALWLLEDDYTRAEEKIHKAQGCWLHGCVVFLTLRRRRPT